MFDLTDVRTILNEMQAPVLSIYLDVNPGLQENQAQQPAWDVSLRNALREIEAGLEGDAKREWSLIRDQAHSYFDGFQTTTRGLALFVDANDLRDYALPFALENQITYGDPQVAPLIWAIDEYEPYVIALVDQEKAHFFVASLGETGAQGHMETDIQEYDFGDKTNYTAGGSGVTGGNDRDDFEDTLQEHRNHLYRDVVARMESLMSEHGAARIILGGSEPGMNDVRNMLTGKLKEALVDVLHIPLRSTTRDIMDKAQPAAEQYERAHEMTLVQQVIDFAKSRGRGALGRVDVAQALDQGRVELLIVPYPFSDEELMTSLTLQALGLNSDIEMVHGEAADLLQQEGGIAARLYYALPPQPAT